MIRNEILAFALAGAVALGSVGMLFAQAEKKGMGMSGHVDMMGSMDRMAGMHGANGMTPMAVMEMMENCPMMPGDMGHGSGEGKHNTLDQEEGRR